MKELLNCGFESLNISLKKRDGFYYWTIDNFVNLSSTYNSYMKKKEVDFLNYKEADDDYYIEKDKKIEKDYWKALLFFYKLYFQGWSLKCRIEENGMWRMYIFYDENFNIWKKEDLASCEILRFIFRKFETHVFWVLKIETTWRFEQIYKMWGSFYKKNFYYEFIDFIDSINEKYLSRVDFFHDYKGKAEDDYYNLSFYRKKVHFYGWVVELENKEIKISEESTIYWWIKGKTDVLVRSYNKYKDSFVKKKLFLYDYLTRDTRRLEFEVKSKYLGKIRTRKKQELKNMSVLDMVGFVYNSIVQQKVGKNTFSFNLHFEKRYMFEKIEEIRKQVLISKKTDLEIEDYKEVLINWKSWVCDSWKIRYVWENKEKVKNKRGLSNDKFTLNNWKKNKKINNDLEYSDLSYVEKVFVNFLMNMNEEQVDVFIKDIKKLIKKIKKNKIINTSSYHYQNENKKS